MIAATSTEKPQREMLRERIRDAVAAGDARTAVQSIVSLAGVARPADYAFAAARLKELGPEALRKAGLKPLKSWVARSVTVEPLVPHLIVHGAMAGFYLEIETGGYGSFIDEMMNPEAALCRFGPDLVFFTTDIEDIAGDLSDVCASADAQRIEEAVNQASRTLTGMLEAFRRNSNARLVVQGFVVPDLPVLGQVADSNSQLGERAAVRRLNDVLADLCRKLGNAVFFDQDALAARVGRAAWRDERMFWSTRLAISSQFFAEYSQGLARSARSLFFPSKKVLCTDLDDTLWGGIVGEDGPNGIVTGTAFPGAGFREYQKYLKRLTARGVLLCIVSKNNENDVREAFTVRAQDLAVSLDDFVGIKVSWQDKPTALRTLAQELSLGLDSFVFVDDNPIECESVRQQLPEVTVIAATPAEPWQALRRIDDMGLFDTLTVTEDDRRRSEEYRTQIKRAELETAAGSKEEFLASLGIVCTVIPAEEGPLSRTAQLTNKTNQFNLTTRRYSEVDIQQWGARPGACAVALRVRDRLSDAGVVGVALADVSGGTLTVDTFLLSCRVIGRGVETALLHHLAKHAKANGASRIAGEYIPTSKNSPCKDFYPAHGFKQAGEPDAETKSVRYELDLNEQTVDLPMWITLEQKPLEQKQ